MNGIKHINITDSGDSIDVRITFKRNVQASIKSLIRTCYALETFADHGGLRVVTCL